MLEATRTKNFIANYIRSKRGTQLVLYQLNSYTPNEKFHPSQKSRDWKCSMYHRAKCRARLVTRSTPFGDIIHLTSKVHTHSAMYSSIEDACAGMKNEDSKKQVLKIKTEY